MCELHSQHPSNNFQHGNEVKKHFSAPKHILKDAIRRSASSPSCELNCLDTDLLKIPLVRFKCLNHSSSISRRLVLSWVLLALRERRLLVSWRTAAGIWSSVVIRRVSVFLVKVTDTLAIPSQSKVGQETPGDNWEEGEGNGSPCSITRDRRVSGFGPLVGQDTEADEPQESPDHWKAQISCNNIFSFFGVAYLWEVGIQYEEDNTSQEGQDSDSHSVAAGAVIFIEHAFGFSLRDGINVAFSRDGCKDHNGEQLRRRDTEG